MTRTQSISEFFDWLKMNEPNIYAALNVGNNDTPLDWPDQLRSVYALHDGQKHDERKIDDTEIDLFPQYGRWYASGEAIAQQQYIQNSWNNAEGVENPNLWQEFWLPIAGFEQRELMLVVDLRSGVIGTVDAELQEFELVAVNIQTLFCDLLLEIKDSGYSGEPESSSTDLCESSYQSLLDKKVDDAERKYLDTYANLNDSEKAFVVGKALFRHHGDPNWGNVNGYAMELAKKYFDIASGFSLSKNQRQELIFFKARYQQLLEEQKL